MKTNRKSKIFPLIFLTAILLVAIGFVLFGFYIPQRITTAFGQPDEDLDWMQRNQITFFLYINQERLLKPVDANDTIMGEFSVNLGDSASQISSNLEATGLIPDADLFLDYLVYKGYDTILQSGNYQFSKSQSPITIAAGLIDPTPEDVNFVVLPGMRFTEISELISTSGLSFSKEELLYISETREGLVLPDVFNGVGNLEGLILAGEYEILRSSTALDFLQTMLDQSAAQFTGEVNAAFTQQGLTPYQAIILASIIEREAVLGEEKTTIASVFLNRLREGMLLQSDPTVQYALGWDSISQSWWKTPLTESDLAFDSPYNTYIYHDLPPTPICSVDINSLISVAFPLQTNYFYFRSACDGSGRHVFAESYAEHQLNVCQ